MAAAAGKPKRGGGAKKEEETSLFAKKPLGDGNKRGGRGKEKKMISALLQRQQKTKYGCYYPHRSRDLVSPVGGFFLLNDDLTYDTLPAQVYFLWS